MDLFSLFLPTRDSALEHINDSYSENFCAGTNRYCFTLPKKEQNDEIVKALKGLEGIRPDYITLYHLYMDAFIDFLSENNDAESTACELYNRVKISFEE